MDGKEPDVSNWIIFARHIVGSTFFNFLSPGLESGHYVSGSFAGALMMPIMSALVTILIFLFFTKTQRNKKLRNFIRTLWVLNFLLFAKRWEVVWPDAQYLPLCGLAALICVMAYTKKYRM